MVVIPLRRVHEVVSTISKVTYPPDEEHLYTQCVYTAKLVYVILTKGWDVTAILDSINFDVEYRTQKYIEDIHITKYPSADVVEKIQSITRLEGLSFFCLWIGGLGHAFVLVNTEVGIVTVDSYLDQRRIQVRHINPLEYIYRFENLDDNGTIKLWECMFDCVGKHDNDNVITKGDDRYAAYMYVVPKQN